MLMNLTFGYETAHALAKMPPEKYLQLRTEFPGMELSETQPDSEYIMVPDYLALPHEVERLVAEFGFNPTVRRVRGLSYPTGMAALAGAAPVAGGVQVTQVSVANGALLEITELHLLTDSCTDEVQRMLADGWRIVAVCPSNDQRRPDYIMGRKG